MASKASKSAPKKQPAKAKTPVAAKPKQAVKSAAKKTAAKPAPAKKPAQASPLAENSPNSAAALQAKATAKPAPVSASKPPLFPIKGSSHSSLVSEKKPVGKPKPLPKPFLEIQRKRLLDLRDHILDQMQDVAQDSLRSRPEGSAASAFGMHQADAGSDAYEKDFALSLLSQEQDALYEIEEALKRIEDGTYGICEMTQQAIPKARLEAIPFARFTVECQSKLERENRGRRRWDTTPQFMDSADNFFEEEGGDDEEEDRPKIKE